jgi:hypothetical protein
MGGSLWAGETTPLPERTILPDTVSLVTISHRLNSPIDEGSVYFSFSWQVQYPQRFGPSSLAGLQLQQSPP